MILSTLEDLWERLHSFPEKIVYFDKTHNIEDSIYWDDNNKDESSEEMNRFFAEYGRYELIDFEFRFEDGHTYLYVEIEKDEDEE